MRIRLYRAACECKVRKSSEIAFSKSRSRCAAVVANAIPLAVFEHYRRAGRRFRFPCYADWASLQSS